jgi:uncharacterized delta-60 repeat protein
MKKIFTLLLFTAQAIHLISQTCNGLDPTFGTGGLRASIVSNNWVNPKNILVQPDNKIIQFGTFFSTGANRISLVRYNSDGTLDNSFGQAGIALSPISEDDYAYYGTLQGDGKIVIAGNIINGGFTLWRFNQNGTTDNSFGAFGSVLTTGSAQGNFATAAAVQTDGKIVAVGSTTRADDCIASNWGYNYCPNHFTMFRLKSNGALDSSFGQNGMVTTNVGPNKVGYASSVLVQPDGKIVVAGSYLYNLSYDYYGYPYYASSHFAMVRYYSNGAIDSSFGKNGVVTDASDLQQTSGMSLQADGKILATGPGGHPFEIERYNSDGSPDSSFATNGRKSNNFESWANSIVVMPNGKISVAGGTSNNILVARLNSNGSFDTSFNGSGKISLHLGPIGSYDNATGITVQGNQVIVGGISVSNTGVSTMLVVRLRDSISGLSLVITPRTTLTPCPGNSVKLAVNETGSIQWFKDGSAITGATDTVYTTSANGDYSVTVQNAKGCGESEPVRVSINGLPVVITPSGSLNFCQGDSVVLTISETGNLQWFKDNIIIPGANTNTYTAKSAGYYFVSAQNAKGCGQSSAVYVNTNPVKPPISWDGANLVTSSSNYTYQWYLNGNSIPGATSYLWRPTELGTYKVVIPDYKCNSTSEEFHLDCNVLALPKPSIVWDGATLNTDAGFANYQWYFNGDAISGAHGDAFQPTHLGSYKVIIANLGCQNASDDFEVNCAVLGPSSPPNIWDGTKFNSASGYSHYQWYQNDTAIAGANGDTYTPGLTQFGYYKVVVTDNNNCTGTSEKQPYFVTALSDIAIGDARVHYYPNPARSVLNVDIAHVGRDKLQAELYDLSGRLLQRKMLNQVHNQLRVDGLSSGLYQLVIYNGTERFATKIAVIK